MPVARSPVRKTAKTAVASIPAANGADASTTRPKRRSSGDPAKRVAALRGVLFDTIESEVEAGNVRVILWLADRLRLLDVNEERHGPAEELRALLDGLPAADLKEFASLAGQ